MTEENDIIVEYLLGEREKLSKPQQAKLDRMYFCSDLIHKWGSKQKVVRLMVSRYKEEHKKEGKGYSQKTALRDYNATQYIFGATSNHNKEYHIDLLIAKMFESRRVAVLTNNATALARWDANYASLIEKFFGDKDVPDYSKLQIPTQIFSADPELLQLDEHQRLDPKKLEKELAKLLGEAEPSSAMPDIQDVQAIEEGGDDE